MHKGSEGAFKKEDKKDKKQGDWKTVRKESEGDAGRKGLVAAMASDSINNSNTNTGTEAVVFTIQFYGKTIGEVGLMDQDLSELDWSKFKSYIFQNLLSVNHQENICVSYSDDEGDKLPIGSEEEYREALKVAKKKAEAHDKLVLDITRQGSLPTVFSIVSSGIKRVSSSPPKEGGISFFKNASPPKESSSFGGRNNIHDKKMFPSIFSDRGDAEVSSSGGAKPKEAVNHDQPPKWFTDYMDKFHEELCEGMVTKLAHMMREELTIVPKDDKENTQKFPQADFKEPKFMCKNLKVESSIQKDCAQPLQLKVSTSPAYDYFFSKSNRLKDDSTTPLELHVTRRHQGKSRNSQNRNSLQLGKGRLKERTAELKSYATKKEENATEDNETRGNKVHLNIPQKRDILLICCKQKKHSNETAAEVVARLSREDEHAKENIKSADSRTKCKESDSDDRLTMFIKKVKANKAKREMEEYEKQKERMVKCQEKMIEWNKKLREINEKKKFEERSRFLEVQKSYCAQGKFLARVESRRKKQAGTAEETRKLQKVLNKHQKAAEKCHDWMLSIPRHHRHSDVRARMLNNPRHHRLSDVKARKSRKTTSKALSELEALAEVSPSQTPSPAILGYDALYMCDITYPDRSDVAPGAQFVKTWRVCNSGVMTWNEKTELFKESEVFRDFHNYPPLDYPTLITLEEKVVCPPLKPGEFGNVSVTLVAPDQPGPYGGLWRFSQEGQLFGNSLWCSVFVVVDIDSVVNKTYSESAQTSTEEENDEKDFEEKSSIEEQSSEEDAPNFVDAAKIVNKTTIDTESLCSPAAEKPEPTTVQDSPEEAEACQQSEYEVGIIENYYDAEDPAEEDTQCVDASDQDSTSDPEATAKLNKDLISFEEEAELVPSQSASSNVAPTDSVVRHSVIPLKDMARESVDSLKDFLNDSVIVKDKDNSLTGQLENNSLDELSISSGSFSDLDSEDQAILNETDTDVSDQDYFVVTLPDCFDLSHPYSGVAESNQLTTSQRPANSIPEAERHDSPDFLTADEDDRTTTAANTIKYLDESLTSKRSSVNDNDGSSHAGSVIVSQLSTGLENERSKSSQASKAVSDRLSSRPLPPPKAKGFMDIPPEALRTNLTLTLFKENSTRPEAEQYLKDQESDRANWSSGTEERQEVVCEQPVSAQVKAGTSAQSQSKPSPPVCDGAENMSQGGAVAAITTHDQLSGDGAAALPDELVSIIPEDLVRGVWNTARTFITRINQEMLSPSANGPARAGNNDSVAVSATPPLPTQEHLQQEERRKETPRATTPEAREEPPSLTPPLQQLADMGFSNHEVNQCLLTKYNNDVACAVAELIVLNCQ